MSSWFAGQQAVDAVRGRGMEALCDWARPLLSNPAKVAAILEQVVASQVPAVQVGIARGK